MSILHVGRSFAILVFAQTFVLQTADQADASIVATYSGEFTTVIGPDTLGLDGASFTLTMEFASGAIYIDRSGLPAIDSISHSFVVAGSTAADGTYFEADQMGFYPMFAGQFFGGGLANNFAVFGPITLFSLSNEVGSVSIGDTIDVSHFGTTLYAPGENFFDGETRYDVTSFTADITETGAVPEPTSVAIWSAILLGAIGLGRRRMLRS